MRSCVALGLSAIFSELHSPFTAHNPTNYCSLVSQLKINYLPSPMWFIYDEADHLFQSDKTLNSQSHSIYHLCNGKWDVSVCLMAFCFVRRFFPKREFNSVLRHLLISSVFPLFLRWIVFTVYQTNEYQEVDDFCLLFHLFLTTYSVVKLASVKLQANKRLVDRHSIVPFFCSKREDEFNKFLSLARFLWMHHLSSTTRTRCIFQKNERALEYVS